MNGLVHIATLGTPHEGKWGTFGGPRAYTKFVQAEPTRDATRLPAAASNRPHEKPSQPLAKAGANDRRDPPKPSAGPTFAKNIADVASKDREAAILREITQR